jgi:hypothetical protein
VAGDFAIWQSWRLSAGHYSSGQFLMTRFVKGPFVLTFGHIFTFTINHFLLKELLDPAKGFLRADGSIEVEVDFIIKSSTLEHMG